jgi:NTE family protein
VRRFLADDVELTSATPFPEHGPVQGSAAHEFVERLCRETRMDLTRKQLARERVTWTVRAADADQAAAGRAEAEFRDGRIVSLRLAGVDDGR